MDLSDYDHPAMRELDHDIIRSAADIFGVELIERGYAHIVLEPDDGTRYEISIVVRSGDRGGAKYAVASNLAAMYPWNGNLSVHPDYAAEHYSGNGNTWTGVVMALFLNATAERLAEVSKTIDEPVS